MENPIDILHIPSGSFLMGSPYNEPGRYPDEGPQHEVTLESFFMSRTPITQAQWREVARMPKIERELTEDPSYFKGDNRPVENMSWYDAMEFCSRLSQHTGRDYTLPSEAQWEYACRAGTTTRFYFGETLSPELANYDCEQTTDVATFSANAWGLHDMHGNVWEWCLDNWHDSYEGAPVNGSAWLEGDGLGKFSGEARATTAPTAAARPSASGTTRTTTASSLVYASVATERHGDGLGKLLGAARGSASPTTASRPAAAGTARSSTALPLVSASVAWATERHRKLLRGGSWNLNPGYCRSAYRFRILPGGHDLRVGFRVCCLPGDQLLYP